MWEDETEMNTNNHRTESLLIDWVQKIVPYLKSSLKPSENRVSSFLSAAVT